MSREWRAQPNQVETDSLAGLALLRLIAKHYDLPPLEDRQRHLSDSILGTAWSIAELIERSLERIWDDDPDLQAASDSLAVFVMAEGHRESLDRLLAGYYRYEGYFWVQWGRVEAFTRIAWVDQSKTPHLFRLVTIAGEKCSLKRENHGWGYHYHYVDQKARRSDVIFSFSPTDSNRPPQLWWERHGENKAEFSPKVCSWGGPKRLSIHQACYEDLGKRQLSDYKRPSTNASVLWP